MRATAIDLTDLAKNRFAQAIAACGLLVGAALFNHQAHAADQATAQQDAQTKTPDKSKLVILSPGPGYDVMSVILMKDYLVKQGCEVEISEDGFIPNSIDVEVDGKLGNFVNSGAASYFASKHCKK